jgi:ATP-dependent DNA helicase DinG
MTKTEVKNIIDVALEKSVFGKDFEFRKHQREAIEFICNSYLEDPNSTVVVDAPTGSGKSLIAMWSAYVLKEMGKRGYLVTSDLMLQDQYEKDLSKLKLGWPSIRGVDNYECTVNGLPFSLGDCKLKGMGYEQAEKLHCYKTCEYLQNRKRAIDQPVSLFNYSFWLLQRNYVEERMLESNRTVPFTERDFTFFDEAHKVDDIVQGHFSPRIDEDFIEKASYINRFFERKNITCELPTKGSVQSTVQDLMTSEVPSQQYETIQDFREIASKYRKAQDKFKHAVKQRYKDQIPADWQSAATTLDRIKDTYCKFDDYVGIIQDNGLESMVIDHREGETRFACVREAQLIKKHLHQKTGFKVFMSATIGDPKSYMEIMGIENAKFIRIDNEFNYDKSPVVFVNRHRLTYKTKEQNLPKVMEILDKILMKHRGQRGIIHTGSYAFSKHIMENSEFHLRMINYSGSKEKKEALKNFNQIDDSILVGPSILEGLDLKDDTSRFQVFFKMPYPNLSDPLVKAKLNLGGSWYDWKTSNHIMQGVGRSIRSKDDWAVTYIIDASFGNLLHKGMFPPNFTDRIKTIQ